MGKRREKVSEKPKTYRSYGVTKLDDNFRISLNIKWLGQIIVGVAFIVLGYLRIENRLGELERRMELADSRILELVEKNQIEEQKEREVRIVKETVDSTKSLTDEDEITKGIKSKMMLDNREGRHVQS